MGDYKELVKNLNKNIYGQCSEYCKDIAVLYKEAADAIEQLVRERDELKLDLCEANDTIEYLNDKLKDFGKERDALKKKVEERCHICKYYNPSDWEWRGVYK